MQIKISHVITMVITPPPSIFAEYRPRTNPTINTTADNATLMLKIINSMSEISMAIS
jgi:hypothetical protein